MINIDKERQLVFAQRYRWLLEDIDKKIIEEMDLISGEYIYKLWGYFNYDKLKRYFGKQILFNNIIEDYSDDWEVTVHGIFFKKLRFKRKSEGVC